MKNISIFSRGDIGASFIILFDNLTVLVLVSAILKYGFHFPTNIIFEHIIPGMVISVLCANLLFFLLYLQSAKRYGNIAMALPNGLDAPSSLGISSIILGPMFIMLKQHGMNIDAAATSAWHITMGCIFIAGLIKFCLSFFTNYIHKHIPSPALLGAIGGIAIAIIGLFPLFTTFTIAIVGLPVLAILLISIYGKVHFPHNIPPIPVAIAVGTIIYYLTSALHLTHKAPFDPTLLHPQYILPHPHFLQLMGSLKPALQYFPSILPFALLVIFGTLSVVEGANKVSAEKYDTKTVVLVDSIATMCGSLFGSITLTTPYAGFIAYKKIDAKAGFLLCNIILIGVSGIFGLFPILTYIIPEAAIAPVLIFVAFEISAQGFEVSSHKYIVAILFAFLPSIARLIIIKISALPFVTPKIFEHTMLQGINHNLSDLFVINLIASGFFVTAIFWGSWLCYVIDHKRLEGTICALCLSIFSLFGIIHSVSMNSEIYLPWHLSHNLIKIPFIISGGYLAVAIITWCMLSLKQHSIRQKIQ